MDVETDPVLQVDAMHRGLKYYHSMMIFWFGYMLLRIWDILTGLKTDPLNTLIYGMGDFLSCISPVVTLICGTDLICYNSWYRKAARTAREEHRFLPAKSRLWLQILERAALLPPRPPPSPSAPFPQKVRSPTPADCCQPACAQYSRKTSSPSAPPSSG